MLMRNSSLSPASCSTSPAMRRSPCPPTRGCGSNVGAPSGNAFKGNVYPTSSRSADLVFQRRLWIDQFIEVDNGLVADQVLDVVEHIPDVDVHSRQHVVVGVEPEGYEFQAVDVTAEHDPLGVRRVAGVYHAQVVLVTEEERQLGVLAGLAEHAGHRDGGLLERVGPGFGPDPFIEQWMLGRGDVAPRLDVLAAGA